MDFVSGHKHINKISTTHCSDDCLNVEGQAISYALNGLLSLSFLQTWPICRNVIL